MVRYMHYMLHLTECEFGDKQDFCADFEARSCYYGSNADYCCKTCKDFHTGITGIVKNIDWSCYVWFYNRSPILQVKWCNYLISQITVWTFCLNQDSILKPEARIWCNWHIVRHRCIMFFNMIVCNIITYCFPSFPDCEYGDKASWCDGLSTTNCYYNDEVCCEKCAALNTGIQGK